MIEMYCFLQAPDRCDGYDGVEADDRHTPSFDSRGFQGSGHATDASYGTPSQKNEDLKLFFVNFLLLVSPCDPYSLHLRTMTSE